MPQVIKENGRKGYAKLYDDYVNGVSSQISAPSKHSHVHTQDNYRAFSVFFLIHRLPATLTHTTSYYNHLHCQLQTICYVRFPLCNTT
jgi:hypothetical protein